MRKSIGPGLLAKPITRIHSFQPMRKLSSAGLEYLLVPDKAENSSVLDKAENPLVAEKNKNLFVPVKIDPDNAEKLLF